MKPLLWTVALLIPLPSFAQPTPAAVSAFNSLRAQIESRLDAQHRSASTFLAADPQTVARLRRGEFIIERLPTPAAPPGAMLHHWRGSAFVPGATAASFEHLLRDVPDYPRTFAPEIVRASAVPSGPGRLQTTLRVRQKHVLTVVMDTDYDVTFGHPDPAHGYSASHSTRIREIDSPGTSRERILPPSEEHGFLWALNTWWTWEQRDGGLYLQVESVSLTRSIPEGLGWAVRPFIESVPRESLEFTLRSAAKALHK